MRMANSQGAIVMKVLGLAILFLVLLTPSTPPLHAAAGDLDLAFAGFGNAGTVIATGVSGLANIMALQPDGKIVAAGTAVVGGDEDFAVARYCSNGKLDNGTNCGPGGFGGDGKVTIGFGADDPCYDIALQDDGKLVLAGYTTAGGFDF